MLSPTEAIGKLKFIAKDSLAKVQQARQLVTMGDRIHSGYFRESRNSAVMTQQLAVTQSSFNPFSTKRSGVTLRTSNLSVQERANQTKSTMKSAILIADDSSPRQQKNQTAIIRQTSPKPSYDTHGERSKLLNQLKRYQDELDRSPLGYRERNITHFMTKQEESETQYLAKIEPLLKKDLLLKQEKPPSETQVERDQKLVNSSIYHHMYKAEPQDNRYRLNKNAERSRQIKLKFMRQEHEWLSLIDKQIQTFRTNISKLDKA